jgi:uncharacterized membrane protein YhaH (DUF805 family)
MDPQAIFQNYLSVVSQHYFDMKGRIGRAQFWYFMLANFVFAFLAAILQSVTFLPLLALYNLAMILPSSGMGARRLQDIGRDGRLIWVFVVAGFISQMISASAMMSSLLLGSLSLIFFGPLVMLVNLALLLALIVLIYFWSLQGDPGINAYGPPPPVFDPSQSRSKSN